MTHRSNGRGSFRLDRRFRSIGRINRASGTTERKTFEAIDSMLGVLYQQGHWDVLKQIKTGHVLPLQALSLWRQGQIYRITNAATLRKLSPEIEDWITSRQATATTKRNNLSEIRRMLNVTGNPEIASVAEAMKRYRDDCLVRGVFDTFNRTRKLILAFLAEGLPKQVALRDDVLAVGTLDVKSSSARHFTVVEMDQLLGALSQDHRHMARTLLFTTMGWSEYTGDWKILGDNRVHIVGTKNSYRNRKIPQFERHLVRPLCGAASFRKALQKVHPDLQVRSFRNSLTRWMASAGIDQWRVEVYTGHAPSTMTIHYQRGTGPVEIEPRVIDRDIELLEHYQETERKAALVPRRKPPINATFQFQTGASLKRV